MIWCCVCKIVDVITYLFRKKKKDKIHSLGDSLADEEFTVVATTFFYVFAVKKIIEVGMLEMEGLDSQQYALLLPPFQHYYVKLQILLLLVSEQTFITSHC